VPLEQRQPLAPSVTATDFRPYASADVASSLTANATSRRDNYFNYLVRNGRCYLCQRGPLI
jgi:hypothetical protein